MKKKFLLILLALVSALCLAFGLTACGKTKDSSDENGIYYHYESEQLDKSDWYELKDGKWKDSGGEQGSYKLKGSEISFYENVFGEDVNWATGTVKDGVLTISSLGITHTYCKEGSTPSTGGPGEGDKGEHTHSFTWVYNNDATCTEDGTETEHCTCGETGDTRTKTGTKLGHDIQPFPAKEATCSESGHSAHNGCTRCGYTSDSNVTYSDALHVKYELNEKKTAYIVKGLDSSCTDQGIAIPKFYKGLPVTSIEDVAFYGCSGLTSVTIGSNVVSIGGSAFAYCRWLTSIEIPDSVTSIENGAFRCC